MFVPMPEVTYKDIVETRERIADRIRRTPIHTSQTLNERVGAEVFLKCENFQRAGSFKIRGASNFLSRLSEDERSRGVVAHSSGNHAQAVAIAAASFGVPAHIVMPKDAPAVKKAATEGYGATVTLCEPTLASREEAAQQIIDKTGGTLVHPFDHPFTIMGQGTAALELMEDVPGLDIILSPISGGGLISGTAIAARGHAGDTRVIGVEPELAGEAAESFAAGELRIRDAGPTMADGLKAALSARTFAIIRELVDDIVLVTEDQIADATMYFMERLKLVVEPSGATALAGLLFHRERIAAKRVGVLVTGGNLDIRSRLRL
jgi:threonine dehydratase